MLFIKGSLEKNLFFPSEFYSHISQQGIKITKNKQVLLLFGKKDSTENQDSSVNTFCLGSVLTLSLNAKVYFHPANVLLS